MRFDRYLSGMVELALDARYTEAVLHLLTTAGISVYQVKRQKEQVWFRIHLDDFSAVHQLLRPYGVRFHIRKREGLPFVISRIKRRRGLWLGVCTGFAVLYMLLSFIWDYEVTGNTVYSDDHLIALVQEYGMVPGAHRDKFDYEELAGQITRDHPEFTWIQLEVHGSTLRIHVKERLPDFSGIHKNGSLVARNDGRITELLVFRGTPLVKRGDWVTKGQVLVGGWDYPDRVRNPNGVFEPAGEPYAVEARAVISGEQEHRAIGSCALQERLLIATGREKNQIALLWKNHQVIIRGPEESPYRYAGEETIQKSLFNWKGISLPIYVKKTVFSERRVQQNHYSETEAYNIAVDRARKRLQETMPDNSRFLHESIGIKKAAQPGHVQVEVVWLVEEAISELKQVTPPRSVLTAEETGQNDKMNQQSVTETAGG